MGEFRFSKVGGQLLIAKSSASSRLFPLPDRFFNLLPH